MSPAGHAPPPAVEQWQMGPQQRPHTEWLLGRPPSALAPSGIQDPHQWPTPEERAGAAAPARRDAQRDEWWGGGPFTSPAITAPRGAHLPRDGAELILIAQGEWCWFVISEEEDLALGSGPRLDHSDLLCSWSFITLKNDRESLWRRRQKAEGENPTW